MKTSAFIATLLTFLMVILVLGAAVFFLGQGRQHLERDVAMLATEVAGANSTATAVRAYVEARDADLGTSEAVRATAEAALATSEADNESGLQTREAMAASRATLVAQSATQEALLAALETPFITIAYPEDGATFTTASSILLVITAAHPQGVDRVALRGFGEPVLLPGGSDPYRVYNHRFSPPLQPGDYTITATVTSRNQQTAADTLQLTVTASPQEASRTQVMAWLWAEEPAADWPWRR